MEQKRKRARLLFLYFIVVLFFFISVNVNFVAGNSMEPTYSANSLFLSYRWPNLEKLERFQVIIFKRPEVEDNHIVKRVVGLPGDRVCVVDGELVINGVRSVDSYFHGEFTAEFDVTVPEHKLFVLGDNLESSIDSRYRSIGFVDFDEITGVALC